LKIFDLVLKVVTIMRTKVKEIRKDGLVYFSPYWEVDLETYVNTYLGCDAFIEYTDCEHLIRVYVCAGSMDSNDALVHVRRVYSRYSKYLFLNISSIYEMEKCISSVF